VSAADIYNFELIVPRAIKDLFTARAVTAFTMEDVTDFQKTRPRIDIVWTTKGEVSPRIWAILSDSTKRAAAFKGELRIFVISSDDPEGRLTHAEMRADVRDVIAGLPDSVNGSALQLHRLNFIQVGQEETAIRSKDDLLQTTFPFTCDIAIGNDAWSLL
jgi:hypothetical protein